MSTICRAILVLMVAQVAVQAQQMQDHPISEKLGVVSFSTTCSLHVQAEFNRGIALLHSFAYAAAGDLFRTIAVADPGCAMAHWGLAITCFHQLWEPPLPASTLPLAEREIAIAQKIGSSDSRERGYIHALSLLLSDVDAVPFPTRNKQYEQAMAEVARQNKGDLEAQVFYALALLSNALPSDKTHARQKQALAILKPLDQANPDHPGITHYIIHACDSAELAQEGEAAARKYAQIAPAAPHALHMPSHIFTRLGMWDDSIASNLAARTAAHTQSDVGEEIHAMDYLVYAYLQLGRYDDASGVIKSLSVMKDLEVADFKIGYAATAMPVRYAIERKLWDDAAKIGPAAGSPPQVAAIAVWARALGRTRGQRLSDIGGELAVLARDEERLRRAGNDYWAAQVAILRMEVIAWAAQTHADSQAAEAQMRAAADTEDALEKLPVSPGPIVPAREQLGELLLEQHRANEALLEFKAALKDAPGRKGALEGLRRASHEAVNAKK